jgi:C1A family cysteine protease
MPKYPAKYKYGWIPSKPDFRDYQYAAPYEVLQALPQAVDLRPQCPPVLDQLNLGSCVSNAVAGGLQFLQMKEQIASFVASRLFIYYNGRLLEGTVNSDSGLSVRDGIQSVNRYGFPPETDWPYDIDKYAAQPPSQAYTDANPNKILRYMSIQQNIMQMLGCLASGYIFLVGFTVYQSFESNEVDLTGVVPMPQWGESVLGGHSVEIVGYSVITRTFIFKNSYGNEWGDKGFGYLPFAYLQDPNLSSDFWNIQLVS